MVKNTVMIALLAALATTGYAKAEETRSVDRVQNSIEAGMKSDIASPKRGEGVTMRDNKMDESADTEKQFSRAKRFVYRFYKPENPSNELVVLLHGSGGNETSLVPLAAKVWPRATLLGVRGRVVQDGGTRWYKRITPVKFDQKDVRLEANAFVTFMTRLADEKELDLSNATFVGYSNGANLLAATMMLHPDMVKRAVLMRSMPVLENVAVSNLSKARVLTITGDDDKLYSPFAPALSALLRSGGARVDSKTIDADHMLGDKDVAAMTQWAASVGPQSTPAVTMQKNSGQ